MKSGLATAGCQVSYFVPLCPTFSSCPTLSYFLSNVPLCPTFGSHRLLFLIFPYISSLKVINSCKIFARAFGARTWELVGQICLSQANIFYYFRHRVKVDAWSCMFYIPRVIVWIIHKVLISRRDVNPSDEQHDFFDYFIYKVVVTFQLQTNLDEFTILIPVKGYRNIIFIVFFWVGGGA